MRGEGAVAAYRAVEGSACARPIGSFLKKRLAAILRNHEATPNAAKVIKLALSDKPLDDDWYLTYMEGLP